MPNLLALDAGGTSTRAVVLDRSGTCLGYGRSGHGNPTATPDLAPISIREAAAAALRSGQLPGSAIELSMGAVAGGRDAEHVVGEALLGAGIDAPCELASDVLALFTSGAAEQHGYALVAGTGAAAVRVADGEIVATADGLGWLLGDAGSGFWIGREVALAAVADLDGGPSTGLTRLALEALEVTADLDEIGDEGRPVALEDLGDRVYAMPPVRLSRLAPAAFALKNDAVASDILQRAREALVATLRRVTVDDVDGPIVLGGTLLSRQQSFSDAVRHSLASSDDGRDVRVVDDGLVGAATLALRAAGITVDAATHDTVRSTLAALSSP
ncbi:N-acetylglucosamine kinase [Luteipulveratus mongoliensis]|uniref:N-acetylglucosamine kinase n=1 Tax=Luteipulveratus mongoliensis TaxID=571913 RepID=UPI000699026E|nr:BadF/BadG/BcrA/BcrD ATPase family protein [Luteipulveratus mongoliensis]